MNEWNKGAIIYGLHYQTEKPVKVSVRDGIIARIEFLDTSMIPDNKPLPWIGPGLVDLQINGFSGIDFNTPPILVEDILLAVRKLWQEGVTTFYPTVITNSDENIEAMVSGVSKAWLSNNLISKTIAGIHLEGPFISKEDGPRGAHSSSFVKPPDWELFQRWQDAAEGLIKIITMSPEYEQAPEFIERCVRSGVVVSIGHTAASSEQIKRAVQAGATMSTHLGNGAHSMMPRHPNYIWDQLAEAQLTASVIADGYHLPESVLTVFMKAKSDQIILVSDAVYLSGMEPGEYETHIGGRVQLTEQGRLQLADNPRLLAGSVRMLKDGINHLSSSNICSLQTAWDMASVRPGTFMHLPVGDGLREGAPGDLVTFTFERDKLAIAEVYKNGRCVFTTSNNN